MVEEVSRVKVGDLVKQVSWSGIGVITKAVPHGFYVLFPDGHFRVEQCDLELISESR